MQLQSNRRNKVIKSYEYFCLFRSVFRKPFLSSLHEIHHVPFNDLNVLERTLACLQFTGNDAGMFYLRE